MLKNPIISDIGNLKVTVVYKRSRFSYAEEHGSKEEKRKLKKHSDPISRDLFLAHENNLLCIEKVEATLKDLGIGYSMLCRSDITAQDIENRFIICVGGDGTLLDASHYCVNAPILGVNSDPAHSIGALCAATADNFPSMLKEIFCGHILPMAVTRLSLKLHGREKPYRPLNDVLFCHENPAAMSRFYVQLNSVIESHRSSGIWVSTGAGSTGGIYSAGADAFGLDEKRIMFRVREPYWTDKEVPLLLAGSFLGNERLKITSNMSDARLFIDGPHKSIEIPLGQTLEIALSNEPLWLFDKKSIEQKRQIILGQRKPYRKLLKTL